MKNRIFSETKKKMEGTRDFFNKEIGSLRAGRASISLLESIVIEYYGAKMPVSQLATITIPQPQLIVVQPWDKNIISDVNKAILSSNLGLNPISDSSVIKIPIPPLSQERREEIVGILHKMGEEAKVEIREIRRKANDELKKGEKSKSISEDDMYKGIDEVQEITDKFIKEIDSRMESKSKEIMEG
ncbi:MAG TPA: ribosome recycling factor [bacterium]|nr:ribosome recycling factor [bacterium]